MSISGEVLDVDFKPSYALVDCYALQYVECHAIKKKVFDVEIFFRKHLITPLYNGETQGIFEMYVQNFSRNGLCVIFVCGIIFY